MPALVDRPLPSLATLQSRRDPRAALEAAAEKWDRIAAHWRRQRNIVEERKALRMRDGYRNQIEG